MAGGTTSCSVRSKALSAPWGAEAAPAPWTGPWVDVCTEHCLWGLGSIRREGAVGWQRPHSCPSSPHMPGPAMGTVPRNSHINPSGTPYSPILWMGTLRTAAEGIPARQEGVRAGSGPRWAGDRPLCSTTCHTAPLWPRSLSPTEPLPTGRCSLDTFQLPVLVLPAATSA